MPQPMLRFELQDVGADARGRNDSHRVARPLIFLADTRNQPD